MKHRLNSSIATFLLCAIAIYPFILEGVMADDVIQTPVDPRSESAPVISCLAMNSDGSLLAAAGDDHQVYVYRMPQRELKLTLEGHQDWVRGLAFTGLNRLLSVSQDGTLIAWDTTSGEKTAEAKGASGVSTMAISPKKDRVLLAGRRKKVELFHASSLEPSRAMELQEDFLLAAAWSPSGDQVALAGRSGRIVMLNTTLWTVATLPGEGRRARALAYSSDGRRLAVGGEGRVITLYDPTSGAKMTTLPQAPADVRSLAFTSANEIAGGYTDNRIRIWNVATGANTDTRIGHTGTVLALLFLGNDRGLASAGSDTTIRLWDDLN